MKTPIHKTTIVAPGFLDVGIEVQTHKEAAGDKWFLYYQVHTWFGADDSIYAMGEKVYLEGTYKGINQVIKVEMDEDALEAVSDKYHEAGVLITTKLKDAYKHKFFLAVAEKM